MTSHELFATMPPSLATDILEYVFSNDKALYRASLDAVAQARKVRSVFLERQPRVQRHASMISTLGRPPLRLAADGLIRAWLLKKHTALLTNFLDAMKITHDKGAVESLPAALDDAELKKAVESLLQKYPAEVVSLYLHAFSDMNDARFSNLDDLLRSDPRLRLLPEAKNGPS